MQIINLAQVELVPWDGCAAHNILWQRETDKEDPSTKQKTGKLLVILDGIGGISAFAITFDANAMLCSVLAGNQKRRS